MFNISVRQQRFYKMWAKQFGIIMLWAIAILIAAGSFALFLMWIAITFGMKVFAVGMISLVIMGIVATFAGMRAEEKLTKLERDEQKTMDALLKEYDQEVASFRSQSPYIPKSASALSKSPAYGKYINVLYGKNDQGA